jgi:molybdenum cofactor biosynthesis enzyme MoaA
MTEDLPLTAEDVAEIVAILASSGYREVDIATNRFRLRVARGDGAQSGDPGMAMGRRDGRGRPRHR